MLLTIFLYACAIGALLFVIVFIIIPFFAVKKPIEETDLLDQDTEYSDNVRILPRERNNEPHIRKII